MTPTPEPRDEILDALAALTRRVHRLERKVRSRGLLLALLVLGGGAAAGLAYARPRERPAGDRILLRDRSGVVRVEIGVRSDGLPGIELRDASGQPRLALSLGASGEPGLVLLAWTGLYLFSVRRAVHYIPLKTQPYGNGFEAMLFDGVLAVAGLVMIIPLFVPSRWRGRPVATGREPYPGSTATFPDLQATQAMPADGGLLFDEWTRTQPQVDPRPGDGLLQVGAVQAALPEDQHQRRGDPVRPR